MKRYNLLAWCVFAIAVLFSLASIALMFVPLPGQPLDPGMVGGQILTEAGGVMDVIVGMFVAARLRKNPIGWLFIIAGLTLATGSVLANYAEIAFWSGAETLPGGLGAAWVSGWIWQIPALALILMLLLFPTGTFLSDGWRWVGGASVLAIVGGMALVAFSSSIIVPTAGGGMQALANPIALFVFDPGSPLIALATILPTVAALAGVLFRFVVARGVEREQMKWVLYAGSLLAVATAMSIFITATVFQLLSSFISLCLPIALGVAILRYRLYDIDIIIRRTLVYATLTALLLLVYFGSIVVLQEVFRGVSGQSSDLAIIISTLTIAALFNPLRRRVQDAIDHRFYRRKYDAQQVLERFAAAARDQVELEKLTGELLSVVDETMQPAQVSLWLRNTGGRAK